MSQASHTAASIVAASLTLAAGMAVEMNGSALASSGKEKCYGVAVAGDNHCANAAGTHACAKMSVEDFHGGDWKLVPAGTCSELGGQNTPFDGYGEAADA